METQTRMPKYELIWLLFTTSLMEKFLLQEK